VKALEEIRGGPVAGERGQGLVQKNRVPRFRAAWIAVAAATAFATFPDTGFARRIGPLPRNPFVRVGSSLSSVAAPADLEREDRCARILGVEEVVRKALALDRKVVCVRALIEPEVLAGAPEGSARIFEAKPRAGRRSRGMESRLGLLSWDRELGIDETLHRPESYEKLEKLSEACQGKMGKRVRFDATFRAVVEYQRDLIRQAFGGGLPHAELALPSPRHYDVELVLLEIVKARADCIE